MVLFFCSIISKINSQPSAYKALIESRNTALAKAASIRKAAAEAQRRRLALWRKSAAPVALRKPKIQRLCLCVCSHVFVSFLRALSAGGCGVISG